MTTLTVGSELTLDLEPEHWQAINTAVGDDEHLEYECSFTIEGVRYKCLVSEICQSPTVRLTIMASEHIV